MDAANPPGSLDSLGVGLVKSDDGKEDSRVRKQEGIARLKEISITKEVGIPMETVTSIEDAIPTEVKSWVTAAQNKKSLKKFEVAISTQDGKHKVVIPDEVLADPTPL